MIQNNLFRQCLAAIPEEQKKEFELYCTKHLLYLLGFFDSYMHEMMKFGLKFCIDL